MAESAAFDGLHLKLELSPVWVDGDETRLEQIVFNLLENATKYSPAGGTITVRVTRSGNDAVLEVIDTGAGVSKELLPRIFDLFAQGDRSIDRSIGGLSIGLTLVKRLTEMHGGKISVASKGVGQGARFTVVLPAIDHHPETSRPDISHIEARSAGKILLVEDNDDARKALVTLLKHYGYSAFEASDGLDGIAVAASVQPHVAIIDIGLPKCDGFEVARTIRATPAGESMLLVALTGYGGDDVRRKVHEAGFDEYLIKPASPVALATLIESHLNSGHRPPATSG
jgi:CheY-like chemotaxis protein